MHIDLSDLPPLIQPSPPSNTLLITNLSSPAIFSPPNLQTIRDAISAQLPPGSSLHSFSPLKSFQRVIVTFYSTDDAIHIRKLLDGTAILGCRAKVYFGEETPTTEPQGGRHLAAPEAEKLFFISPPPSPPHGWQMRNEEPPNKAVHADDLASALAKLRANKAGTLPIDDISPVDMMDDGTMTGSGAEAAREAEGTARSAPTRTRSGTSTVVYHPGDHGGSPGLPAVMVEDTSTLDNGLAVETEGDEDVGMRDAAKPITHTARPPVELMDCS